MVWSILRLDEPSTTTGARAYNPLEPCTCASPNGFGATGRVVAAVYVAGAAGGAACVVTVPLPFSLSNASMNVFAPPAW